MKVKLNLNPYLSDSTHEGLHVRSALTVLSENPESSPVNRQRSDNVLKVTDQGF